MTAHVTFAWNVFIDFSWHLQVSPDEGFAARVVKVALHEEVEKMGGIIANGAQLGVATLEDLIAEGGTHVGAAFEKRAGELRRGGRGGSSSRARWESRVPFPSLLHTL